VYDGKIPPSEVFAMDDETLFEADAALDIYNEAMAKAVKKKR
jgi:hypothetical protein